MRPSLFTNWKSRTSSLGKLLTSEEKISQKQLNDIEVLQKEKKLGVNANGNKVKFTDNKAAKLANLIALRDAPEVLPIGVKTHLDKVFNHVFWQRRRILKGNQIEKGTQCETDSLQLLTDIDGVYYAENKKQFSNDYLTGEPDNYQLNIKEIKSNYDKESFDNSQLTSLYQWQIRGYCWLTNKPDGELIYCLVNNPIKELNQAIYYLKLKHDVIDAFTTEESIKEAQQIERNMIFDIKKWNKDFLSYVWHSTNFDFDIPKELRIKRFNVQLLPEHIIFIKKRIKMARDYLQEKEQLALDKMNPSNYKKQIKIIKNLLKK